MNYKKKDRLDTIVFTGGGSAGHVLPNLQLIQLFKKKAWQVIYIGSGIELERLLIKPLEIDYYAISTGKLRRYFSWQNCTDLLRVLLGIKQAIGLIRRLQPRVVFAKGGYVSFPVVVAAWLNRIPVISHESDFSPGLANRLSYPFVEKVCTTFADTLAKVPSNKGVYTGTPVRADIFAGDPQKARTLHNLPATKAQKPVLLVLGGSLGSKSLNALIDRSLAKLIGTFQIIHQRGANNMDVADYLGYNAIELLLGIDLLDAYALADVIVSRAGANTLYELLVLRRPHLLLPLTLGSRGEQLENASISVANGWSMMLDANATPDDLFASLVKLYQERELWQKRMQTFTQPDSLCEIAAILLAHAKGNSKDKSQK